MVTRIVRLVIMLSTLAALLPVFLLLSAFAQLRWGPDPQADPWEG